jgi:hypothetical protein
MNSSADSGAAVCTFLASRPDNIHKKLVNDDVAHRPHLRPWKPSVLIDEFRCEIANLVHGLADDFDVGYNRILNR